MKSVPPAVAGGPADCGISIADLRLVSRKEQSSIRNHQFPIHKTHPLPRGGTDLIGPVDGLHFSIHQGSD